MATSESPAVARRRVRLALRAAREAAGLTQTQIAEAMEWSLSKVMRIESGEVTITPIDLRALLACLGVTDQATVQELLAAAKISRSRQSWWFEPRYREALPSGLLKLIQFEAEATKIRHFNIMGIPGLLQTPQYARAMLGSYGSVLSEVDMDVRAEARMRRQREFFARADRPVLLAMFDESMLHREVGGPAVMAGQLRALLNRVADDRTLVRIVPLAAAAPIAFFGPFSVIELGGERDAVLYRERALDDEIVEDERMILEHRDSFEQLWSKALGGAESAAVIRRQIRLLEDRIAGTAVQ